MVTSLSDANCSVLGAKPLHTEATIFVLDEDGASRDSVVQLAQSMQVKGRSFATAEEFLGAYDDAQSGCLVTELRLPTMSGLELLQEMRRRLVQLPTIVTTNFADVQLAVRAMQAGALTLLQKPWRNQDLWDSVRKALALDAQRRQFGARLKERRNLFATLSADEQSVLDRILIGQTNKGIARELQIGLRTVEARRNRIMAKLKVESIVALVQLAWEVKRTTEDAGFCDSADAGCRAVSALR
jgi:two-component system, LuxR family, response regulator FixJ